MEISIVIPVHDEGALLLETLDSVAKQRWALGEAPSYEVLVVEDRASSSETRAAIEVVKAGGWSNVEVLVNKGPPGPGSARNTAIRAARGRWVAFLDGDDLWTTTSLHDRLAAARNYPSAGWVGSDFIRWNESEPRSEVGSLQANIGTRSLLEPAFLTGRVLMLERPAGAFLKQALCWTGTVMVRRDLLLEVGLFDETLLRAQDVHLWYRLAAASNYVFVPKVLGLYRQRASTVASRGHSPRGFHNVALKKLLMDPVMLPWREDIRSKLASTLVEHAQFQRSQKEFLGAIRSSALAIMYGGVHAPAVRQLLASLARRS